MTFSPEKNATIISTHLTLISIHVLKYLTKEAKLAYGSNNNHFNRTVV